MDYDNGFMTKEQNGLTHDELDERSKLVDKLQSSLVPSIKAQLVDFLASLNVQDYSKKKSDAGFKLILENYWLLISPWPTRRSASSPLPSLYQ
ncbi:hypothetical protein H4Q26_008625 [Puccinia striiformis f. sp. tritici PST-130]|nr:hypothetical protein H4Q26_008625 [Puccinia striiformis f. sp. tritici PST-130]